MTPADNYREVVTLILSGRTIDAVRLVHERFCLDLRESKHLVEAIMESIGDALSRGLAAEREECAKVAEDENHRAVRFADGSPLDDISMRAVQREIAAAIRARK